METELINDIRKVTEYITIKCPSKKLEAELNDFISSGSKLVRTKIALLFFYLTGYKFNNDIFKILAATELIHNSSLIHDDIIDDAVIRRNKESLNEKFDSKLSVIAGDYLITVAVQILLNINKPDIIEIFASALSKMCIAESEEYFNKNKIITIKEYLRKTNYKTAELFKAEFKAISKITDLQTKYNAIKFAHNFGMAFQIKNDLDDFLKGKNSNDIKEGIYTLPYIIMEKGNSKDFAIEKTFHLMDNYCIRAKNIIKDFSDNKYKKSLMEQIDKLCRQMKLNNI